MSSSLSVEHMRILKVAAKLVDPDALTQAQHNLLDDAIVALAEAITGKHEADTTKMDEVREQTLAHENDITGDMNVETLAGIWMQEIEAEQRVQPQTIDRYETVIRNAVLPVLGQLQLRELTVGLLDRFLKNLIKLQVSQTRSSKVVLNQMLGMAVRHGALPTNPIRDVGRLRKPKKIVQVLTLSDLDRIRTAIRQRQDRPFTGGPRPSRELADIVDLMLATGARIGEILALRWHDIDLDRKMLTVCGTLVFVKKVGWSRQAWPKSEAGHRTIFLPGFAVEMLLTRRPSVRQNDLDAVFVSRNGTWLQPDNVRRSWRTVREEVGLEWVTPHVFRKTVATLLHEEGFTKEATAQLGHSTEDVTKMYYVAKPARAPDVSTTLELLGPRVDGELRHLIQARIAEATASPRREERG